MNSRWNLPLVAVAGALCAVVIATPSPVRSQQSREGVPLPAAEKEHALRRGEILYRTHCQSCHGEDATGDGPLAEHLKVEPSNLRELGSRIGGYSEEWLAHVIDGREEVRGHGTREMPVWGVSFREPGRSSEQESEIQGRIDDLVEYVLSIQSSRGDAP